eukprot:TRINITY_DN20023_c0_g1_i1.p1 TRINITY_DN20023_c0_g1~~TRINITY_DN20023_c0_g1_i1.p1  ORF type:complete len:760 (+),score=248.02 TRINITY_DN20023_c0_g1_i1:87-2282(+)
MLPGAAPSRGARCRWGRQSGPARRRGRGRRAAHWQALKVELGGSMERPQLTYQMQRLRDDVAKYTAHLSKVDSHRREKSGPPPRPWTGPSPEALARELASRGDVEALRRCGSAWERAAEQGADPPPDGLLRDLGVQGLAKLGRHQEALQAAVSEGTPPTLDGYAALADVLAFSEAAPEDWLQVFVEIMIHTHRLPLLRNPPDGGPPEAPVLDRLLLRLWPKSPLLAWLLYGWKLSLGAPATPATYQCLLLSLYKQPHYWPALRCLLDCPAAAKNTFVPEAVMENVVELLRRGARHWRCRHYEEQGAGAAEAEAAAAPALGRGGLPGELQLLSDGEQLLLRGLTRGWRASALQHEARLGEAVSSLCFNCRAETPGGMVHRVLCAVHRTREVAGQPCGRVYEGVLFTLQEWGRNDDVAALWDAMCTAMRTWAAAYIGPDGELRRLPSDPPAGPPAATARFVHTRQTLLPALRAAAANRDPAFSERVLQQLRGVQLDRELVDAALEAQHFTRECLAAYHRMRPGPDLDPGPPTLAALLRCALETYSPPPLPSTPSSPAERPPPPEGAGQAVAAELGAMFPPQRSRLAAYGALPPLPPAPRPSPRGARDGGADRILRAAERCRPDAPPPAAPDEDALPWVLAEMRRLTHVELDGPCRALLVANWLKRREWRTAAAAYREMTEAGCAPQHEHEALWRRVLAEQPHLAAYRAWVSTLGLGPTAPATDVLAAAAERGC